MAIIAIGIYIPFSTFGNHIGLLPLPGAYFIWLALILLCYCLLTQVVKMWFVRKFEGWL